MQTSKIPLSDLTYLKILLSPGPAFTVLFSEDAFSKSELLNDGYEFCTVGLWADKIQIFKHT